MILRSIHTCDLLGMNYCVNYSLNDGLYCTSFGRQRHEVIAIFDVVFMGGRGSWFVYMIVPHFPCKHEKIILQINLDVFHFDAWEMYKE